MITRICRKYTFDSCHFLPYHKGQCHNLHGHSYKLWVTFEGAVNKNSGGEESGMVMDFKRMDSFVNLAIDGFDHGNLNDYFDNPTAENMSKQIFQYLNSQLISESSPIRVYKVRLWETEKCYAEVVAE